MSVAGLEKRDLEADIHALRRKTIGPSRWRQFVRGILLGTSLTAIAVVTLTVVAPEVGQMRAEATAAAAPESLTAALSMPQVSAAMASPGRKSAVVESVVVRESAKMRAPEPPAQDSVQEVVIVPPPEYFLGVEKGPLAPKEPVVAAAPAAPEPEINAADLVSVAPIEFSASDLAPIAPEVTTEVTTEAEVSVPSEAPERLASASELAVASDAAIVAPNISISGLEPDLSGPAIEVNARAFTPKPGAPLIAIVLKDATAEKLPIAALGMLQMPLTMAIPTDVPGAEEFAAQLRAAGYEVLAQLPLGSRRTPEELAEDTTMDLVTFNMAIGATGAADGRIVSDRAAMSAILTPMAKHGYAFLDLQSGISPVAAEIAAESGQPYASVERLAVEGASEQQVFQVLEGAAFQAEQNGMAIVSISSSSDAVRALLRWGIERSGTKVQFAPLSALIR